MVTHAIVDEIIGGSSGEGVGRDAYTLVVNDNGGEYLQEHDE